MENIGLKQTFSVLEPLERKLNHLHCYIITQSTVTECKKKKLTPSIFHCRRRFLNKTLREKLFLNLLHKNVSFYYYSIYEKIARSHFEIDIIFYSFRCSSQLIEIERFVLQTFYALIDKSDDCHAHLLNKLTTEWP